MQTSTPNTDAPVIWTIIVAAGAGNRFGGPKQLALLDDLRVVDHALATAASVSNGVVVVVPPAEVAVLEATWIETGPMATVGGGATRSASVRAGLAAVPDAADVVLVHDAARPLASADLFHRVIAAVAAGADAVVPGIPVADTIRRRGEDGAAGAVVDRGSLVAVQTPQGFPAATLRHAHSSGLDASDDASLVEAEGGKVVIVDGEPENFKITVAHQLGAARAVLDAGHRP